MIVATDRVEGGDEGGHVEGQKDDEDRDGKEQVDLPEDVAELREFRGGQPLQVLLDRLEADDDRHRGVVEDGRDRGDLDHRDVGRPRDLRQEKGRGPHHRRHQLAARRRGGLHGAGEMGLVAHPLHQGDRVDAVDDHVGHGASRRRSRRGRS